MLMLGAVNNAYAGSSEQCLCWEQWTMLMLGAVNNAYAGSSEQCLCW